VSILNQPSSAPHPKGFLNFRSKSHRQLVRIIIHTELAKVANSSNRAPHDIAFERMPIPMNNVSLNNECSLNFLSDHKYTHKIKIPYNRNIDA